jgi:hypothetical protein
MGKKLTITLTDRRPVVVDTDVWPLIASVTDHDGQVECQANRRWKLAVRQCQTEGDDRCVVYGILDSVYSDSCRGGQVVENLEAVPGAVKTVAEHLGFSARLADECIADLPAEEL